MAQNTHFAPQGEGPTASTLLGAINAYKAGMAAYSAHPIIKKPCSKAQEQQAIAETYGPLSDALENWTAPATSLEEVRAAIEFAIEEGAGDVDGVIDAALRAALGYFERPAAQDLAKLIERYRLAQVSWELAVSVDDRDEDSSTEWDQYGEAELAVRLHPCTTLDEVQAKVRLYIEDDYAYDTIRNCGNGEGESLVPFLRSLLGEGVQS